ncbi:hypothetical protein Nepgr_017577 [Nepenthes gracilis]|uniref:eIF-4F 25 kDa subunit n=1 Tax=Nepenthes gracilis TaxID=150966 RepID=A0AAD3XTH6_NEPGR|nr:hypothetical protein Nepgr_017577 [Nepenthes gracilis]
MEESVKSTFTAEEEQNQNPKPTNVEGGIEEDETEEGEIVEGEEVTSSLKPSKAISMAHPLENSWTFWFDNPSAKLKQAEWGTSMRPIYTFSTVEEFWSIYNNIHHPSTLVLRADLYCFKYQIEPKWEDPICANGGSWTANFPRGKCDTAWLYTLLAMIGEQFDHGNEICGAVVNVRNRQDKIALWTKNAADEAAQLNIGQQWKKFLDYNDSIGFVFHEDSRKLDKAARNRYTI